MHVSSCEHLLVCNKISVSNELSSCKIIFMCKKFKFFSFFLFSCMISVFANVKLIDGQILVKHDLSSEMQSVEKKGTILGKQ